MSYSTAYGGLRLGHQLGMVGLTRGHYNALTAGATVQNPQLLGTNLFVYVSTDSGSTDINGAVGYFPGLGMGSQMNQANKASYDTGCGVGDLILCIPTSNATVRAAKIALVLSATANQSNTAASSAYGRVGYDLTVATS